MGTVAARAGGTLELARKTLLSDHVWSCQRYFDRTQEL